ncbi:hypothetical protein OKW43_006926 [Paraburkholderia sp. WC7.3g]|uniref:DUF2628 domain-containing protein n=1 Tax=Paraburkholderia podalyriae TaxID=1938811 RepID=A0ABR7PMF5_9BURK|nr:hypothetical protein [Paraburkholderia podalyriae]MBC8747545.1 hypothetical protein [Paraburkholderia podalyriae]
MTFPQHLRRIPILLVPFFTRFTWAGMLIMAVYTNVVGWFVAQDMGDLVWIQYPLMLLAFTVGFIGYDLWCHWQYGVAHALYIEDVIDGVCPDTEQEICEAAMWHWYAKRGRPWWISRNRERPQLRFVDGWRRMAAYRRAMKAEAFRLRKNQTP